MFRIIIFEQREREWKSKMMRRKNQSHNAQQATISICFKGFFPDGMKGLQIKSVQITGWSSACI